jgi:rubrerythrin
MPVDARPREPEKVHPRYRLGFIEAGGGDTEFICLRCGFSVTITPRYGETPPSTCPDCGFAAGDIEPGWRGRAVKTPTR